jgi:hypothetical protein
MPIQITAKRDAFRRCGMAHSDKTQTYPDGYFTAEQLQELERESQLIVVRIDDDKPAVTNGPRLEDVLADHQELQRRASIIDALSEQLAIEREFSESLQQELAARKVPPASLPDDQTDKQIDESAGGDKTPIEPAKAKK